MAINAQQLRAGFAASKPSSTWVAPIREKTPDQVLDDDHVPLGLSGLMHASAKLLHVNQGLTDPDDRDSYAFKAIYRNHDHLAERIKLDAGKLRRKMMYRIVRDQSLKGVMPSALDGYTTGFLIGTSDEPNQLSAPLEETNPMHLVENAHRITMMGAGGIGSDDQITPEAQAINGTQFGFIDLIAGPECHSEDTEVLTGNGWVDWKDVNDETEFACSVDGVNGFSKSERIIKEHYEGEMFEINTLNTNMLVTPSHQILLLELDASRIDPYVNGWKLLSTEYASQMVGVLDKSDRNYVLVKPDDWKRVNYKGMVYCATVPGGLLYTRRGEGNTGVWSGNSSRAGVDVRMAKGVRISDKKKLYQQFRNFRTGETEWVDAREMSKKVLAMPE